MNPITIPNISIPTIGIPTIGIPSVGFPSASGGGLVWPAGLKESIKAIYDPKKQGMTNYDVIEAYVEDFTKFIKNGNGTFTQNKYNSSITTQEWLLYKTNGKEIEAMDIYITADDNVSPALRYYYYTSENNDRKIFNLKVGLNHLPASCYKEKGSTIGIVFEAQPASEFNITITQLPTSILKDLSGNGNHAYLYGGKGKLNSGIGLYTYDYNSDRWSSTGRADYIITKKGFEFTNIIEDGGIIFALGSNIAKEGDKVKVKISGIPNGGRVYFGTWITATEDGEYFGTYAYDNNGNTTIGTLGCIGATITLEFIPDYPDQLCYDGKMYAVCYGFPILEDYTVMADRTWFDKEEYSAFVSNSLGGMEDPSNGAFSVEVKSLDSFTVMSFGSLTSISTPEKGITYQTKQSYNGISINVGTRESNDVLTLGGRYYYKNDNNAGNLWNGCHGKIIIADRSFTEDEITWLKDNWEKI